MTVQTLPMCTVAYRNFLAWRNKQHPISKFNYIIPTQHK